MQNQRRKRSARYFAEEPINILDLIEKRRRRANTVSDRRDIDEWENEESGLYTKDTNDKTWNSGEDDSGVIIVYRKMSDTAEDDETTDTNTKDTRTEDEEFYLRTSTLRIPTSRLLRSRKNRTGVCLEEKETEELEHIIDEMNPVKLKREDSGVSEDFQDCVSDLSGVIADDVGATTLPSDYMETDMDKIDSMTTYYYFMHLIAGIFVGIALCIYFFTEHVL